MPTSATATRRARPAGVDGSRCSPGASMASGTGCTRAPKREPERRSGAILSRASSSRAALELRAVERAARVRHRQAEACLRQRRERRRRRLGPAAMVALRPGASPRAVGRAKIGAHDVERCRSGPRRHRRRQATGGRRRASAGWRAVGLGGAHREAEPPIAGRPAGRRRFRRRAPRADDREPRRPWHCPPARASDPAQSASRPMIGPRWAVAIIGRCPRSRARSSGKTQKILATAYFPEGLPPEYLRRWRA